MWGYKVSLTIKLAACGTPDPPAENQTIAVQSRQTCFTNQQSPAEQGSGPFEGPSSYRQLVVADFQSTLI
jgi:hypothetical protein